MTPLPSRYPCLMEECHPCLWLDALGPVGSHPPQGMCPGVPAVLTIPSPTESLPCMGSIALSQGASAAGPQSRLCPCPAAGGELSLPSRAPPELTLSHKGIPGDRGRIVPHQKCWELGTGSYPPLPRRVSSQTFPLQPLPAPPFHGCTLPFPAPPCSITSYCSLQAPSILLAGESRACPCLSFPCCAVRTGRMPGGCHDLSRPRPRGRVSVLQVGSGFVRKQCP